MIHKHALHLLFLITTLLPNAVQARYVEHKEHSLGPTGLLGVTSPKDIKITKVAEGSPADGKLKADDVIIGVGGSAFKGNTRGEWAEAIDRAETKAAGGRLEVMLQGGEKVELQLNILGSYSATAPFNCQKTEALVTQTADYIVKSKKYGRQDLNIGLLALLATGEQKYIKVVKNVIHEAKWASPDLLKTLTWEGHVSWGWGYTTILLCEYHLMTGDKYVLPAIEAYAVAMAQGRDAMGLWGHGMAQLDLNDGRYHGRLKGYAVMNQSSIPLFLALMLADKCGIRHPEVQAGIEQTYAFYKTFINKGTLPYGVHDPKTNAYNNNGMSGLLAVAMSVRGDQSGAAFFSKMALAGHKTLEKGHTGHFFSQLWTGLGANLAGPDSTKAFFKETHWLHTFNRLWDGNFTYDGIDSPRSTYSYRGLSDAGSHLLNHCVGRRKLYITGKDPDQSIWLKSKDVDTLVSLAKIDWTQKSDAELLTFFGHEMPKIRHDAAYELRKRKHSQIAELRKLLKHGNNNERSSAKAYFTHHECPVEQIAQVKDELAAIMRDASEPVQMRAEAAGALCWLKEGAYPYYDDFLRLILEDKPDDYLDDINATLGIRIVTVTDNPYKAGLVKNKEMFYKAASKLIDHKRFKGRLPGMQMILNVPLEDFHIVADKVIYIIEDKDTTYQTYHGMGPITQGIAILAKLKIKGGLEYAFGTLKRPIGKAGFKLRMLMEVIPQYGSQAKYALAEIKATNAGKFKSRWDKMVKNLEALPDPSTKMITFEEAVAYGKKKSTPAFPGRQSKFFEYDRYDFSVNGLGCKVVVPKQAAPGNPWIWRGRFFGHAPQLDQALLAKGFHVAYVSVKNLFGNPEAVTRWDKFYQYLTEEHSFSKKPVLEGMSRGGLIIYNWASKNPDKVACIYGDAPVCDIKSWPGGKMKGIGGGGSWKKCLDAYGFTEEEAMAFKGNPIDNLAAIAKAGIPIIHVVGDIDVAVPVAENSAIIEKRYKALGGHIEVIHKKDSGHHPHSLDDPKPLVDFIMEHLE